MTEPSKPELVCAVCSTPGTGRFCANCGALLEASTCAGCGAQLSPGVRFCHICGRAAGSAATALPAVAQPAGRAIVTKPLLWIVAVIATIMLLAFFAGSEFSKRRGTAADSPRNAPQTALGDRVPMGGVPADGAVRGPDISQLSPEERADRLFNRVMLLAGQGKTDSVLFFAPMAINAYQLLSPLNADQRYDIGRIAEVAGALQLAKAQADTILAESPTHLLGIILALRIASLDKDTASKKSFEARLLSAYSAESRKQLPGYGRHAAEISAALAEARRSTGASR